MSGGLGLFPSEDRSNSCWLKLSLELIQAITREKSFWKVQISGEMLPRAILPGLYHNAQEYAFVESEAVEDGGV